MEKEKIEDMLIDYIDGALSREEAQKVEEQLGEDANVKQIYLQLKEVMDALKKSPALEPSRSLKINFDQALREEQEKLRRSAASGRQIFITPFVLRAAAAILVVVVAGVAAYWIQQSRQQQQVLADLQKEMAATRRLMMAMLDNDQSASTRMKGATVAFNMEKTDDEIVKVLVRTMNQDPNTNVRLAALEALEKFNRQAHVRKALIASLATQKDPLVQIALIQLMVRMKEKGAIKDLEDITNNTETMKAVKDEAYNGLMKLS